MEEIVISILKDVLGREDVDCNCTQESCDKWDSMAQLNIIAELESAFNIDIEPEDIAKIKSFPDIMAVIRKNSI